NTKRIMKLNDLVPELQELVSKGSLGTTAGEQLAHMTEDNQRALLNVLGDEIERATVAKAKDYRSAEKDSVDENEYEENIQVLQKQVEMERKERERLEQQEPKVIEKEVIKEIDNTDYNQIHALRQQLSDTVKQLESYKKELKELRDSSGEYIDLEKKLQELYRDKEEVENQIEAAVSISTIVVNVEDFIKDKVSGIKYTKAVQERVDSYVVRTNLEDIGKLLIQAGEDILDLLPKNKDSKNVIDVEVID